MNLLPLAVAAKLIPFPVFARTGLPINHRWLLHVFKWRFGVVDFGESGGSTICLGALNFETSLTAPAVAGTAAVILIGALAFAAVAIRNAKRHP